MSPAPVATERCAEERRLAAERCELATRARSQADAAAEALRTAQRSYDAHEAAALDAASRADPRAIHAAKEAAQGGFRAAVRSATDPDALEAAARDWLTEINRINNDARDAAAVATREHAASAEVLATLERLTLDADAARIGAANADAACLAAREAVAECDERAAASAAALPAARARLPARPEPPSMPRLDEDETLGLALEAGSAPRIFRMLHGDRAAMSTVVASLAGDDPEARRRWQLLLTGLVEAIVADAIEAGYLEFPDGHAFWGSFTRAQNRDITQALSSLGFRFDGLGGWLDGRVAIAARHVARAGLRRPRPDAGPELAERGGHGRPVQRRDGRRRRIPGRHRGRPHPRRDGDDARPPGGRPGRDLEPVGSRPPAPARGVLTDRQPGPSSSSSSMTTSRRPSAAATPILAPSSAAHDRIRSASPAGSWIWLAWARRASIFRSIVADTSIQVSARSDQNR